MVTQCQPEPPISGEHRPGVARLWHEIDSGNCRESCAFGAEHDTISSLFAAAVETAPTARSPVRRKILGLAETTVRDREYLPPGELHALSGAVPANFSALVLTAGVLGLRRSETIALRPSAIHFLARKDTIDRRLNDVLTLRVSHVVVRRSTE
jgi:integrase